MLDVLDHGAAQYDRYDVLLTGKFLDSGSRDGPRTYANTRIAYIGLTETGAWNSGDIPAYQAAQYRYRSSKKRIRWSDLPKAVRDQVREWAETCAYCDGKHDESDCPDWPA